MAKCDEGYRCDVCGQDVTSIVDSDLYLRYVIGQLDPEKLHLASERHIQCNPVLAQFIDDYRFDRVLVDLGGFAKSLMDEHYVMTQTDLVSRGYRRLWEISEADQSISLLDYPLASQ